MNPNDGESPLPEAVRARLERLAPDQRAAATAPPGPILCVAPAGSGKTTTLVARVAWLVATGADPAGITAITFNTRAAQELRERLDPALAPLGLAAGAVRVRTFHALGLEILRSRGGSPPRLVARAPVLRRIEREASRERLGRLDTAFSRLKLDLRVTAAEVARDPAPGPIARAFLAYEATLAEAGAIDFDDLVGLALRALAAEPPLLARWRERCAHLLVDEAQDVDASQLALALLLAAPANRIFLVGDDDQSIYGWRLADVRRVLGLAALLPGLSRVDLVVNYRCPGPVVERAVRLVACNRERFVKEIRPGPRATGRLVLAPEPTAGDPTLEAAVAGRLVAAWPADGGTRAILARTRRELLPAAAFALEAGIPFRADRVRLLVDEPQVDALLAAAEATPPGWPLLRRLWAAVATASAESRQQPVGGGPRAAPSPTGAGDGAAPTCPAGAGSAQAARARPGDAAGARPGDAAGARPGDAAGAGPGDAAGSRSHLGRPGRPPTDDLDDDPDEPAVGVAVVAAALVAWGTRQADLPALRDAIAAARARLAALRAAPPDLTLATAHSTKGLEFDHVAVIGMSAGRFPSARALADAAEPDRALEEERRLAYVAWTRARRTLTLVFEPDAPSPFLGEAFDPAELAG